MLPDEVKFPVLSHRHSPNPPLHKLPVCGRWSQVLAPHLESRKDTRRVLPVVSLPGEFLCVTSPISVQSSRPAKAVYRETFTTIALFMSSLVTIWCAILIAHQIVMAKHGGSCVHFSGISTCGRTSRETVSHSQREPLPTPHKIALPVYVTVTNKRLQTLTATLYNSLVLSFSLLTTKRR